jgi:hypothetical protein
VRCEVTRSRAAYDETEISESSSLLRNILETDYLFCGAPWRNFVVKRSAKHTRRFSHCNKLCLMKIDRLVFKLSEFKQRNRKTRIVKTFEITSMNFNLKICLNVKITNR